MGCSWMHKAFIHSGWLLQDAGQFINALKAAGFIKDSEMLVAYILVPYLEGLELGTA